jgi:hypothetical protein
MLILLLTLFKKFDSLNVFANIIFFCLLVTLVCFVVLFLHIECVTPFLPCDLWCFILFFLTSITCLINLILINFISYINNIFFILLFFRFHFHDIFMSVKDILTLPKSKKFFGKVKLIYYKCAFCPSNESVKQF